MFDGETRVCVSVYVFVCVKPLRLVPKGIAWDVCVGTDNLVEEILVIDNSVNLVIDNSDSQSHQSFTALNMSLKPSPSHI